jgi:hypothetical protein
VLWFVTLKWHGFPSAYKSDVLDFFAVAGAPGVYNKATGSGFGAQWAQPTKKGGGGFVAGVNYVAQNGSDSSKGQFDETGALNTLAQDWLPCSSVGYCIRLS